MNSDAAVRARQARGFLAIDDLMAGFGRRNVVLDPAGLLISENVRMGRDNVFYPNVVIEQRGNGCITIGNDNVFYPGTYLLGSDGIIEIGDGNEFGPAGLTIKANVRDAYIGVGNEGRYCDGASIMGKTILGTGSQVLGNIIVQSCTLAAGGSFRELDPDKRAGVLKGFGLIHGVTLGLGRVMNGAGDFTKTSIQWQHEYHSRPQIN